MVEVNILPYHAFAADKSQHIGREYPLGDLPSVTAETAARWIAELQPQVSVPVRQG